MGQTHRMTTAAVIALAVAALFAGANWWSRWSDDRRLEVVTKPATLVALIGVALLIDPIDPAVRAWFVAALVLSLVGDVFLLGGGRLFVPGLASFLAGHLAYIGGFVAAPTWRWWAAGVALVPVAVVVATAGRRIVAGARSTDDRLGGPVVAYLTVISAMLVAASAAGNAWAIIGATLFVVSDTILGWSRFVRSSPPLAPAIMITYHLAQAALVVSLV